MTVRMELETKLKLIRGIKDEVFFISCESSRSMLALSDKL